MAHIKKGHLIESSQWWRHLRHMKRPFWGSHRQAERRLCQEEVEAYDRHQYKPAQVRGSVVDEKV